MDTPWCDPATAVPEGRQGASPGRPDPDPSLPGLPSSLCAAGWQMALVGPFLVDLIRRHFHDPSRLSNPDLRRLVWRDDAERTILVNTSSRWEGETPSKFPAVIVKRNGVTNLRAGIADLSGATAEGHRTYATWWAGSHTVFCCAALEMQADVLACEVQQFLTENAAAIVRGAELDTFRVREVGPAGVLAEAASAQHRAVPLTVLWAYSEQWVLEQESRKLRGFDFGMTANGEPLDAD